MTIKSPFYIDDNFLAKVQCEDIIDRSFYDYPNVVEGVPQKSVTRNVLTENRIVPFIEDALDAIEDHFDGYYHKGILPTTIEYYPEGAKAESRCENSLYIDGKWMRNSNIDLVGIIFLKSSVESSNVDPYSEVYGSRLEFISHQFGFTPQAGQLIVFPGNEYFVNTIIPPKMGDLYAIRFHLVGEEPFEYDPKDYPGNYKNWFK